MRMNTTETLPGLTSAMVRLVRDEVPELADGVEAQILVGGRSNLTFLLKGISGQRFVLRRPPLGEVLASAHDMRREWSYISALRDTQVPVAVGRLLCTDPSVSDAPFYVMEYVDGHVMEKLDDTTFLGLEARHRVGLAVVDALVALHAVNPVLVGLASDERASSKTYLSRQLDRWQRQIASVEVDESPSLVALARKLGREIPLERTGIAHGDFRLGNLSISSAGEVLAIFDWELATVGDTMADLGWLISSWQEPGELDFTPISEAPSAATGFATRAELVDRYAASVDVSPDTLAYYEAFARWRMACISVGVRHRYESGAMGADGFDPSGLTTKIAALVVTAHDALARADVGP
jgi:aminoglycoside phosphotransferase (APT) family kinase protein